MPTPIPNSVAISIFPVVAAQAVVADVKVAQKPSLVLTPKFAHELRNPLAGIMGNVRFLKRLLKGLESTAPVLSQLDAVLKTAENLIQITKQVLDTKTAAEIIDLKKFYELFTLTLALKPQLQPYTNNDDAKRFIQGVSSSVVHLYTLISPHLDPLALTMPEPAEQPIDAVIQAVTCMYAAQAKEKNIHLNFKLRADVNGIFVTKPSFIRQVLINLIKNAIEASPCNSEIKIDLQVQAQNPLVLQISVEDTGPGMSEEFCKKIGQDYCQDDSPKIGGVGLGLSICKKLLESELKSKLDVRSVLGKGSVFTFDIIGIRPVSADEKTAQLAVQAKSNSPIRKNDKLKGLKILLAEDQKVNQDIIKRMLEEAGAECIVANHGQEAIDNYHTGIDIVLLDIGMPKVDGIAAAKEIRVKAPNVNIIALSGSNESDLDEKSKKLFNGFLTKPCKKDELYKKINELLGRQSPVNVQASPSVTTFSLGAAAGSDAAVASVVTAPAPTVVLNTGKALSPAMLMGNIGFHRLPAVTLQLAAVIATPAPALIHS